MKARTWFKLQRPISLDRATSQFLQRSIVNMIRSLGFRSSLVAGLAMGIVGFAGIAVAEEVSETTTTAEESPEPTKPGNWWDRLIGTMKDDGGSNDPEGGVE
jgi:hypothetical protein